jgi:benzylsuccinate CoA-transferase BbsF subunit
VSSSGDVFGGLKVWDAAWAGVGPLTTRYLGDYGATVVHTESSRSFDVLRGLAPFHGGVPGVNRSQWFAEYNASKLGLGVNFATAAGRDVGLRLAQWADVVVESFSPGVMERFGLGYDSLRAVNASLVMLSTSMSGQTGPRRTFAGYGNVMAAVSGICDLTGWPDRPPGSPYGAYTDFIAQRFCASALIAALDHRARTGEGQFIDVAQYEASLQFLAPALVELEASGLRMTRDGNRHPRHAPHAVYRCRDDDSGAATERWIAIAVEDDDQWQALGKAMGSPPWATSTELASSAGRKAAEDELDRHIAAWTADRTATEIFGLLQPDVPVAPVQSGLDMLSDPQLAFRGYLTTLVHGEVGEAVYEGSQAILSVTQPRPRKAAPCFAEDNRYVLGALLGYTDAEIGELIAAGVVEVPADPAEGGTPTNE